MLWYSGDMGIGGYIGVHSQRRGWLVKSRGEKRLGGVLMRDSITPYVDRFMQFFEITRVNATMLDEFRRSSGFVVVGYTGSGDLATTARFENLAKAMHPEVVFGMTDDSDLARAEGIDAPAMVVYNNSMEERYVLPIIDGLEAMKLGVRKAASSLIVDLYPETHEELHDVRISSLVLCLLHRSRLIFANT